jgi:rfaE bifunctional protein nucleotidyltransferase chain/domain
MSRQERIPPSLGVPHGRIVFTNGCFDILHSAHVDFLQRCRELGDWLIVGLNSDASVKRLKGPTRPICNQEERLKVLRAIRYVDECLIFDEDTPCELIERVRPSTICKGPGYSEENMPESAIVKAYGGRVVILDGPDTSTTKIIEKIRGGDV